MISFIPKIKFEEIKEADGAPPAESKDESNPPPSDEASKEEGNTDEFGYAKDSEESGDKKAAGESKESKESDQSQESEEIKDPATGYGDEPKVEEVEPPKEEEKKEDAEPDEMDKVIGSEGLAKEDVEEIKSLAAKAKMTPEQVKVLADFRRGEIKAANEYAEKAEREAKLENQRQRAAWHKELKEDKDFGGENFTKNISKAEKVLGEFMPQTKKVLTDRKGMLPPYVMRDLAKLAEHLYSTEKLVTGDPKGKEQAEEEVDDALAFYQ